MINQEDVLKSLALAIDDSNFNLNSTVENTENWDSLGLLAIVSTLSKLTSGRSDNLPELLDVSTALDLINILRENGLVE